MLNQQSLQSSKTLSAIAFALCALSLSGCATVGNGEAGVRFDQASGKVSPDSVGPGWYSYNPFSESLEKIDVKTQKLTLDDEEAVSSDQQVIHTSLVVNYHPRGKEASSLYKEVGFSGYEDKVVKPVVKEALKAEIAKHPVDQLLANRETVSNNIMKSVARRLAERHIEFEAFSLVNLKFSKEYQQAVEAKQVALQQAEAKRNELSKAKIEAEITRTQADAEAYKIEKTNESLRNSPGYIQLEAVRKLNPNAQVIYVPQNGTVVVPSVRGIGADAK